MKYEIYGEYELPRRRSGRGHWILDFSNDAQERFWEEVDEDKEGLWNGRGCYIFAIRAGGGIKPWYIGQSKNAFYKEVFAPHKKVKYNEVCNDLRGTPALLLVARLNPRGDKLSNSRLADGEADFLEQLIIGLALKSNTELLNKSKTKMFREMEIPGVLNPSSRHRSEPVQALCKALGIFYKPTGNEVEGWGEAWRKSGFWVRH